VVFGPKNQAADDGVEAVSSDHEVEAVGICARPPSPRTPAGKPVRRGGAATLAPEIRARKSCLGNPPTHVSGSRCAVRRHEPADGRRYRFR
jgi:hypothetical protein